MDGKGLHHLVWEIVDNAVDEYLNGHADAITVILHKSGDAVTVQDNGRGIPVDMHPKLKKPGLEVVLTSDSLRATFEANTPMGRPGEPEDIACAVLYLASPASSWVTGKVIQVDGGTERPSIDVPVPPLVPAERS